MPGPSTDCNPAAPDARLAPLLADFPPELFNDRLYRSIHWADTYVLALALDVLGALGAPSMLGEPVGIADLARSLALAPGRDAQLRWLLDRATTAGVVVAEEAAGGRTYRLSTPWQATDTERLAADGLAIDEGNRPTIALLQAAATAWPRVVRGELSGEDALLNPEVIALWLDYFDNANLLYSANNRVAAIVAARQVADCERFSILELGAGAGSGTEALLQELDRKGQLDRLERYVVTEPSTFFRRRSERKLKSRFRAWPLTFASLDIDRPWAEQGVDGERFELIYGVNVLHVAKVLGFSLREARVRLTPGGTLVAGECIRPFPHHGVYIEFVFELLDSFNNVVLDRECRPRSGFLTPEEWRRSLSAAGFVQVDMRPNHFHTRVIFPHLLVAAVCGR